MVFSKCGRFGRGSTTSVAPTSRDPLPLLMNTPRGLGHPGKILEISQVSSFRILRWANLPIAKFSRYPTFPPFGSLDGPICQSLAISERNHLSRAILQFHMERMLHKQTPIARSISRHNKRRVSKDHFLCFWGGDMTASER